MERKYIWGGVIFVLITGIVIYVMNNMKSSAENTQAIHEEHHEHDDHSEGSHNSSDKKTVTLNKAQYNNASIELGWFEMKNLSEVVHANGYTKLPPQNQADVSIFTTGLVKSIKVIEGQAVKKGQVLATVESPEFTILQQEYLMSKSRLDYLKLEYERQLTLKENDVNAGKVFEKTKADLEVETALFNSLKKQLSVLKVNGDGNTISSIPVVAPISGHITEIFVNIGSAVDVGKPLFAIVDNSEMHVDLLVYEKDLFSVKEGQNVRFVLTNQSNKEIGGTIFNIGKSFENETKTVAVHAHIEAKEQMLIPGMYVNALIDVGINKVRTLSEEAIVNAEGRNFIFIYKSKSHHQDNHAGEEGHDHHNKGMVFNRVEVKTGASQLGFVEVTPLQKIPEKSKIVVSGAYYLQSHLQKSESGGEHSH